MYRDDSAGSGVPGGAFRGRLEKPGGCVCELGAAAYIFPGYDAGIQGRAAGGMEKGGAVLVWMGEIKVTVNGVNSNI